MFKTISAAVLAVSVLAAPAMANTVVRTHNAPVAKHIVLKRSIANANAKVIVVPKHHHHHRYHRHGGKKIIVRH
ncbi:MAG TPA: hypothetical protein VGC26_11235 [Afipia sp.]